MIDEVVDEVSVPQAAPVRTVGLPAAVQVKAFHVTPSPLGSGCVTCVLELV